MGFIIIIANVLFSLYGLTSEAFLDKFKFEVDSILIGKDYKRLITSGFLHVSWVHLIFNMLTLYAFYGLIENYLGGVNFLIIYFSGLIGGGLFSLFIHRNHGDYSAVGASGAVCGIVFAAIALFPGMGIGFFGLPFSIPSRVYAVLFLLYSIYGIRSKKDNIGHEAHLGGALIGMLVALLIHPAALPENYVSILLIFIPTIIFVCAIIFRPHLLMIDNLYYKTHRNHYSIDHKYNEEKKYTENEIDMILDKINKKGIGSLSPKEKFKLRQYSKSTR